MGAVLGLIVLAWFHNVGLSLVIFAALTCNLLLAACAGVLIPVTLKRMGFDPALSSGLFLTAITDSSGFFTFLGLATSSAERRVGHECGSPFRSLWSPFT